MELTETLAVTLEVATILEDLGAPCVVGGSVASSLHGIPRATQDVDVVARLDSSHVPPLLARLKDEYYVDEGAVRDAIRRTSSFNIIHLGTMFKVDVFICGEDALKREEFSRAQHVTIDPDTGSTLLVADAADIILQKLIWYELGNRVSERQWRDVIGVIKVSGDVLDMEYLKRWALKKNLWSLVEKAFIEAGRPLEP
jgi:hypothetical protein